MDIFNVVFQPVVTLLGIGVLGFWIARRGIILENVIGVLSRLAIDIALPSLVFANIMLDFAPAKYPEWWQLPLWWLFFTAVVAVLTAVTMFVSRRGTRSEFALSLFFQNGIFFPLIIITGIFGKDTHYLAQLFIFIVLHPSLYFGTYHLFFRNKPGAEKEHKLNWRRIVNPVLVITIVAMALRLFSVSSYLPPFFVSIFHIVGAMALPLLMLILGGSLYMDFHRRGKLFTGEVAKFVLVKNIVFPLAFLGILILLRPDYNIALIMILQAAVPPITGIPIVTEREGGNRAITNQFILASFIFSIVSIPAIFTVFNTYFPMP